MTTNAAVGSQAAPRLGGAQAWLIWAIATTFVVWLFNFQTGYAIVNADMQKDVGLTIAQVGSIGAIYTWVFAVAQFFSGALLDRLGARRVLPVAIALMAIGAFMFANADSFGMVAASQFVMAVGASFGFVGAGFVGGKWFGMAKFGFMFGLVQTAAAVGSSLGQAGIDSALGVMSWRELATYGAYFGVAMLAAALLFVRDPEPVEGMKDGVGAFFVGVLKSMGEVCKNPQIWLAAAIGAISFGLLLALGVIWGTKILQEVHGMDVSTANQMAAMLWFGLALGSPVAAKWSDLVKSRKQPIIIMNIMMLAGVAALLYMELSPMMAGLVCFFIGFANGGHMLSFTAAADMVKPQLIGTSAAIVNGSMFIAGGFLMGMPGKMLDGTDGSVAAFQGAFTGSLISMVICVVLSFVLKETFPKAK